MGEHPSFSLVRVEVDMKSVATAGNDMESLVLSDWVSVSGHGIARGSDWHFGQLPINCPSECSELYLSLSSSAEDLKRLPVITEVAFWNGFSNESELRSPKSIVRDS